MKRMNTSSYEYTSYSLDSFDSFYCSFKFLPYNCFWSIWSICFLPKYAKKHWKTSFMFKLLTLPEKKKLEWALLFVCFHGPFYLKTSIYNETNEKCLPEENLLSNLGKKWKLLRVWRSKIFLLQTSNILYNILENSVWWWQP